MVTTKVVCCKECQWPLGRNAGAYTAKISMARPVAVAEVAEAVLGATTVFEPIGMLVEPLELVECWAIAGEDAEWQCLPAWNRLCVGRLM